MKPAQALLLALLSLFCCFFPSQALAAAAKQQRQHLRARASRASGADDGEESGSGEKASDDGEEDDDDDDEEEAHDTFNKKLSADDDKAKVHGHVAVKEGKVYTVVGEGKAPEESEETEGLTEEGPAPAPAPAPVIVKSPHAKEEATLKKAIADIEEELAANLHEQAALRTKIEHLEDGTASDKEIDANAKLVANETDSLAMATMLARMWKEMRMFEVPFFAQHVEEELTILKKEEKELNAKLEAAEAKLAAARKKWAAEAEGEASEAPAPAEKEKEKEEKEAAGVGTALHDAQEGSIAHAVHKMGDSEWMQEAEKYSQAQDFWAKGANKLQIFINSIIMALFIVIFAYIYNLVSKSAKYSRYFTPDVKEGVYTQRGQPTFSFSLFSCFSDMKICLAGCLCGGCRWAQTLERNHQLKYWQGIAIVVACEVLASYTFNISGFVFILVAVYYRQKLREYYSMEWKTPKTVILDCLSWACCSCCSIIQEAREEVARPTNG